MAQYWVEIASDTPLSQFTRALTAGSDLTEIVTDGAFQALKFHGTEVSANGTLSWNVVGSASDMEVMALCRRDSTSTTRFQGPAGRIGAGVNTYQSRMRGVNGSGMNLIQGGSYTTLQNTNFNVATVTEYHWRKLGLTGTTVREKVWTGAVTDEPSSWRVSVTDSTLASGGAGLGSVYVDPLYVRVLSVGTDGDPAPTGPVGGARRRSPLLLTPW